MIFIVIGIVIIAVSGFVSKSLYSYALAARRQPDPTKPFGGLVPAWISLIYLVGLASILYGLYQIIF